MKIHPAILVDNTNDLLKQLQKAETFTSEVDIDVIDWHYTSGKTVDIESVLNTPADLKFNFDLMLDYPAEHLDLLLSNKRVNTIIFNWRSEVNFRFDFDIVFASKIKVGISINPENEIGEIIDYLPKLDLIQIYTVEPGAQGNKFLSKRLELSYELRAKGFTGEICVDGGINPETVEVIKEFPVDIISVGSYLSKAENPKKNYEKLVQMVS
ncbi:MAG: hypothetical protein WCJ58_04765 [bacterium]